MRPALVIFDCDGVLVDSEPISLDVLVGYLGEQGCDLDHDTGYRALLGRSMASVAEWLRRERGFELTEAMLAETRARLFARFDAELQPIPGIAGAVRAIGGPVCVASSSQPERIRRSLTLTGLLPLFEPNVYSATMVARGKPAPDLFLFAASGMGADPADCVVIEDSPAGLTAAKAAGMRAVAFTGGSHAGPARLRETVANCAPDAIIDRMEDLTAILRQLG
ncbi:HAD family phosphatase [Mangrovicoccus sp. HB161399]|uniref:HAD family hydrolase n=1 Tax=Mangrovicoccus sp. HB161399 TaxID=2720392 RepID=UPI001552D02D|nr:HAD family hydrolase [Mangrovicoccus sp. HB161399]